MHPPEQTADAHQTSRRHLSDEHNTRISNRNRGGKRGAHATLKYFAQKGVGDIVTMNKQGGREDINTAVVRVRSFPLTAPLQAVSVLHHGLVTTVPPADVAPMPKTKLAAF